MTNIRGVMPCVVVALCGLAFLPTTGHAQKAATDTKLPDAVKKTFEARFPKGEIEKVEAEEEGGVTVYDIEFKDGETEKETDITADGTMLEYTVVIAAKAVPEAAMKPIREAAAGATMKRVERIEISHETRDGKTIKLPRPLTHYAVDMEKGAKTAEVVVAPDGEVVEAPKWTGGEEKKAEAKKG
jgi:hypothetical protein